MKEAPRIVRPTVVEMPRPVRSAVSGLLIGREMVPVPVYTKKPRPVNRQNHLDNLQIAHGIYWRGTYFDHGIARHSKKIVRGTKGVIYAKGNTKTR